MGFFRNLVGAGTREIAKVQNRDLLEGIVNAATYVAAEGGISRSEADQLAVSLSTNKALAAFAPSEVSALVSKVREQIENSPRMAKLAIKKEVEECGNNPEWGMTIVAVAADVADSEGGISDAEVARLREICTWAKQSPSDHGF
jgi:tellurite resistance protein